MCKYKSIIYWSEEDEAFTAEIARVTGLHSVWRIKGGGSGKCKGSYSALARHREGIRRSNLRAQRPAPDLCLKCRRMRGLVHQYSFKHD
jgi:hypothetical protein